MEFSGISITNLIDCLVEYQIEKIPKLLANLAYFFKSYLSMNR